MKLTLSTIFRMFDFSIYFSNYGVLMFLTLKMTMKCIKVFVLQCFVSLEFEAGKSTFFISLDKSSISLRSQVQKPGHFDQTCILTIISLVPLKISFFSKLPLKICRGLSISNSQVQAQVRMSLHICPVFICFKKSAVFDCFSSKQEFKVFQLETYYICTQFSRFTGY